MEEIKNCGKQTAEGDKLSEDQIVTERAIRKAFLSESEDLDDFDV